MLIDSVGKGKRCGLYKQINSSATSFLTDLFSQSDNWRKNKACHAPADLTACGLWVHSCFSSRWRCQKVLKVASNYTCKIFERPFVIGEDKFRLTVVPERLLIVI